MAPSCAETRSRKYGCCHILHFNLIFPRPAYTICIISVFFRPGKATKSTTEHIKDKILTCLCKSWIHWGSSAFKKHSKTYSAYDNYLKYIYIFFWGATAHMGTRKPHC